MAVDESAARDGEGIAPSLQAEDPIRRSEALSRRPPRRNALFEILQ